MIPHISYLLDLVPPQACFLSDGQLLPLISQEEVVKIVYSLFFCSDDELGRHNSYLLNKMTNPNFQNGII